MIPKSFKLMGLTIKVQIAPKIAKKKYGDWDEQRQLIRIAPLGEKMSKEMQLQTFWHEALHAALDALSYQDLSKDEAFVDRLAQCVAQIELTRK